MVKYTVLHLILIALRLTHLLQNVCSELRCRIILFNYLFYILLSNAVTFQTLSATQLYFLGPHTKCYVYNSCIASFVSLCQYSALMSDNWTLGNISHLVVYVKRSVLFSCSSTLRLKSLTVLQVPITDPALTESRD